MNCQGPAPWSLIGQLLLLLMDQRTQFAQPGNNLWPFRSGDNLVDRRKYFCGADRPIRAEKRCAHLASSNRSAMPLKYMSKIERVAVPKNNLGQKLVSLKHSQWVSKPQACERSPMTLDQCGGNACPQRRANPSKVRDRQVTIIADLGNVDIVWQHDKRQGEHVQHIHALAPE